jgi:hypothetical protein
LVDGIDVKIEIKALPTATSGLVLHRWLNDKQIVWVVTHVATGRRVGAFGTKQMADRFAARLGGKGVDWTVEDLASRYPGKMGKLSEAVAKLRRELGGENL